MPDVFVNPEGGDVVEAGRVSGHGDQQRPDRPPDRAPGRPELPSEARDGRVLAAHLPERPPCRAGRQQGSRSGDVVVDLGERADRARRFGAAPGPLAPDQPDRPAAAGNVDQRHLPPAASHRHDAALTTTHRRRRCLHHHPQPARPGLLDGDDVGAGQAHEQVAAVAVAGPDTDRFSAGARVTAPRRLGHVEAFRSRLLGRS